MIPDQLKINFPYQSFIFFVLFCFFYLTVFGSLFLFIHLEGKHVESTFLNMYFIFISVFHNLRLKK